jgi:hypothetical protein
MTRWSFGRTARGASSVEYLGLVAVVALASVGAWQRYTSSTNEATLGIGGKVVRMEAGNPVKPGFAISGKSNANTYAKPALGRNLTPLAPLDANNNGPKAPEPKAPRPVIDYDPVTYAEVRGTPFVQGEGDDAAVSPNDVKQGEIGDCYFIAALTAMADRYPEIIEKSIITDGKGQHWVRMFDLKTGRPTWNMPGQSFPVGHGDILYAQPGDIYEKNGKSHGELWPMLFEKAFANRTWNLIDSPTPVNGYMGIGNGGPVAWGLYNVTGLKPAIIDAKTVTIEDLSGRISKGELVLAATVTDANHSLLQAGDADVISNDKLFTEHAYYVQSVDVNAKTVTVQNPHGWRTDPIVVPFDQVPSVFNDFASSPPGAASPPPSGFRPQKVAR